MGNDIGARQKKRVAVSRPKGSINHKMDRTFLYSILLSRLTLADSGCWVYTGSKWGQGYGRISIGGSEYSVHRIAAWIFLGEKRIFTNRKLEICHSCDNPPCFSPHHLVVADATFNNRDTFKKGRWNNGTTIRRIHA